MFDGFDNYDTVSEPSWNICVYIDTKFSSTARILKQNIINQIKIAQMDTSKRHDYVYAQTKKL